MKKRGQLTIFILLGVVIIAVIVGFFLIKGNQENRFVTDEYFESDQVQKKIESFRLQIDTCIDTAAVNGLILVAFQGGYYEAPSRSYSYAPFFFPYYYYDGTIILPTLETIQTELGNAISDNVESCINAINDPNFKISFDDAQTKTTIEYQNVFVQVDLPITIETEGHKMTLDTRDFSKNYNASLYEIYDVAKYITESHKEDSEYYCASCVAQMAQERGLYVYMFPNVANEKITGIMIYENRTGIGDPYAFVFLNKYTGNEKTPKLEF